MPKISLVAKNYAKALFVTAKKHNSLEKVTKEIKLFRDNFSKTFASELKNPIISKTDLSKIMKEILSSLSLSKISSDFLVAVSNNRRINLLPEICEVFFNMVKAYEGILNVSLISSHQILDESLQKIQQIIERSFEGKKIVIHQTIDKDLIGGFQIKINSQLIDASIKNEINQIGSNLLKATQN